jgi:outer membrane lipoprotein carrier protein
MSFVSYLNFLQGDATTMNHLSRNLCLLPLLIVMGALWASADSRSVDIDTILTGVEARYAGKGFSASFFQESMLKAMQINDTAQGMLTVRRPGKMRWEYTSPDPQTIITDGQSLWIYRPADNQVMVGKAPDFFSGGKGAGFLSDIRQIRNSFAVELAPAENPEYHRLKLVPLNPTPELATIRLSVHKTSFQVDQVVTTNAYGDETRIVLSNYAFNMDPDEALFHFKAPEGIDVVQID